MAHISSGYYNADTKNSIMNTCTVCILENAKFQWKKIARSEQSSHTPGGSHQRLQHFQRKDKMVKDFIILNQVVSEKTLMKNVHMCYPSFTYYRCILITGVFCFLQTTVACVSIIRNFPSNIVINAFFFHHQRKKSRNVVF